MAWRDTTAVGRNDPSPNPPATPTDANHEIGPKNACPGPTSVNGAAQRTTTPNQGTASRAPATTRPSSLDDSAPVTGARGVGVGSSASKRSLPATTQLASGATSVEVHG